MLSFLPYFALALAFWAGLWKTLNWLYDKFIERNR